MKLIPEICLILFTATTAAFSQAMPDSSTPARADIVRPEPSTAEAPPDSLLPAPTDSAGAAAQPAEPAFDFRHRPDHFLRALHPDSTAIIGSRYTSFGDIFDWLPGGYHYNRGGAGQLSYGALFGAPAGEMILEYDGLNLNDPFTGLADFSLIPTESMGSAGILHSADKPYGYMPIGQALQFTSRTIADNPIRSQVGYRTGAYSYNDIDVRLGVQASRFWLDVGGVIRGYGGLRSNEGYSGAIVNAKFNRRFGADWLLRYVVLYSLRDAEMPLPGQIKELPAFLDPKQKDGRIDHALSLAHRKNFSATLQYTQVEDELRAANKSAFFVQNKAASLRGTSELILPVGAARWRSGVHAWATRAKSDSWSDDEWQVDAYSSLAAPLLPRLHGYVSLKAEQHATFAPQLLPELNLFFSIDSTAGISAWANRIAHYPSMIARYSPGPFARGDVDLSVASYDQLALAAEKRFDDIFVHVAAAWMRRQNQISIYYDGADVTFRNMPTHSTLCLSGVLDVHFLRKWRFILKGDAFSDLGAEPVVTQRPNLYAKTFLQYHLLAFQGDLDAELRLGAFILGRRSGPAPFYADYSIEIQPLQAAIYPYLHAVLHYGAADIFIAYENYIDADVQYVYGYSMPQMWFRYGFIWHFID